MFTITILRADRLGRYPNTELVIIIGQQRLTYMKTMTCKELGGPCDQKLSAGSWDEMVGTMTKHVMENHPDTAKEMEEIHNEDPEKWGKEMKPKWEAALETN